MSATEVSIAASQDAARFANATRVEGRSAAELRGAAAQDASRISVEEGTNLRNVAGVNLDIITAPEAKILMSEEHKALGYRPPPGSIAADAQAAAATHGDGSSGQRTAHLKEAARADAARIAAQRGEGAGAIPTIDLENVTKEEAAALMSEEHKRLGYRPPPGSIAAQAQSAADKLAAGKDVSRTEAVERNMENLTKEDAAQLMSEEHHRLGHQPPKACSLAAQVQSAVDKKTE